MEVLLILGILALTLAIIKLMKLIFVSGAESSSIFKSSLFCARNITARIFKKLQYKYIGRTNDIFKMNISQPYSLYPNNFCWLLIPTYHSCQ